MMDSLNNKTVHPDIEYNPHDPVAHFHIVQLDEPFGTAWAAFHLTESGWEDVAFSGLPFAASMHSYQSEEDEVWHIRWYVRRNHIECYQIHGVDRFPVRPVPHGWRVKAFYENNGPKAVFLPFFNNMPFNYQHSPFGQVAYYDDRRAAEAYCWSAPGNSPNDRYDNFYSLADANITYP